MRCPMDEKRGPDILIEYCSGTLAPEKAVAVDQHSAECPACSEFIARQRAVWSGTRRLRNIGVIGDRSSHRHAARGWSRNFHLGIRAALDPPAVGILC